MKPQKLLVILSRFPFPLEKGDKLRAFHQIRELSNEFEVHLCCVTDKRVSVEDKKALEGFCKSIDIIQLNRFGILWNLFLGVFSSKPFQYHYFYQKSVHRKLNKIIEEQKPKFIYCQLIRTARYAIDYPLIPKTLDYMDALSAGMKRRSESAGLPMNLIYRLESIRLAKMETYYFDQFDKKVIISERDRSEIGHPQKSEIGVIPNGIGEKFFNFKARKKDVDILFTGNMNYPPNVDAAIFLVKKVLPLLQQKGMQPKVLISGIAPNNAVRQLASEHVTIGGWVDDIRESYARSKVFVAPMFMGSGLQNKLLEAMAMGVPCITSTLVNESLKAKDGEQVLIADDEVAYAEKIEYLLKNVHKAEHLAESGRAYVLNSFNWKHFTKNLVAFIRGESKSH